MLPKYSGASKGSSCATRETYERPSFTSRSRPPRAFSRTPAGSPSMKKRTVSVSSSATTATCCHLSLTTRLVDVGASRQTSLASACGTCSTFQNINVPGACVK